MTLMDQTQSPSPPEAAETPSNTSQPAAPLEYEETPEIAPVSDEHNQQAPPPAASPQPAQPKKPASPAGGGGSCLGTIVTLVAFVALFVGGIWASSFIRQFFPSASSGQARPTTSSPSPTPTGVGNVVNPSDSYATWKMYQVISGTMKLPIPGVSFKLPADVLSPICDGTPCASQGTYLPGGTRFTVAARGTGQGLRDYRGSVITDVTGTAFTTKPTIVAGKTAVDFTGTFAGRTVSGYAFNQMHGVMVELSPTESLEINHFSPMGLTVDFEGDEPLFAQILETFVVGGAVGEKGTTPSATFTPTPTKVATSSGY